MDHSICPLFFDNYQNKTVNVDLCMDIVVGYFMYCYSISTFYIILTTNNNYF